MWNRVVFIFRKEVLQVLREPRMLALLVGPPLIQLLIFGYAVNLDVENNRLAWMDRDRTPESRELRSRFEGSRYFRIVAEPQSENEVQTLLDSGQVVAFVRILPGFAGDLQRNRTAEIQVLVDGTNSNTASIVVSYISRTVAAYSATVLEDQLTARRNAVLDRNLGGKFPVPGVQLESRVWFNPNLLSQDYFVPGVVVNIIALVTILLTSMAVVREKEIGTMEQLMVTPIRPLELMLGKTLPFAVVGVLEVILVTSAALLIFGIPFKGSALMLLGCSVLFLLTTLGIGLLISTISSTQQQAMMGSFFFFLPAFMLSGFAFPIRNMPLEIQYLTYLNPIRYFLEIVRGIFLKGIGFDVLWPQMLALILFGVTMIVLSSLRFHKRLD